MFCACCHHYPGGNRQLRPRQRRPPKSALTAATRYETIADGTGDKASIVLGARMLALTHHDLGNLKGARQYVASVLSQAPQLGPQVRQRPPSRRARRDADAPLPGSNGCRDFPIKLTPRCGRRSTPRCGCIIRFRFATSFFLRAVPFRSGLAISQRPTSASRCFATGPGGIPNFPGLVSLPGFTRQLCGYDKAASPMV